MHTNKEVLEECVIAVGKFLFFILVFTIINHLLIEHRSGLDGH